LEVKRCSIIKLAAENLVISFLAYVLIDKMGPLPKMCLGAGFGMLTSYLVIAIEE
jgi:hypothetical protein